jgi:ABC-type bacteriocin/lantibiotic exporter with double-glycine peptidase domain
MADSSPRQPVPIGHGHGHDHPSPPWRYLDFLRPEAGDMATIVVYGAVGAVLALAVPLTVDALISSIMFGAILTPLVVLVGILLGCLLLQALLRGLQVYVAEVIERRIFVRVAGDLAWRLPRADVQAFDRCHGPELVNRFFDTVTVQKSSSKLLVALTNLVLQSGVGLTVLSFYHPLLLYFTLSLLAALAVVVFGFGRGGVRTAVAQSRTKYEVAAWLQELARHTTAFCTAGGMSFARQRTEELCRSYLSARRHHFQVWFRQVCASLGLQVLASTAVLGFGGWLVIDQQLTPGQLVASELIVTAAVANLTKLGEILQVFYDACAAADKLGYLVDLPLERQTGADHRPTTRGAALRLQGVTSNRADSPHALREFDLDVAPGERIALVGSPGGVASHLLDVLFGLREPSGGYVTVDGLDLRQLRLDTLRNEFALVHGTEIVEGTILDNLRFGRDAIGPEQVRQALDDVGLWEEVLALPQGLDTRLTTRGEPLSTSQASRLMLARAILGEPRLLLLDGALDMLTPKLRARVVSHLLGAQHEWTVLVVTQMPDVIAACGRRIELEAEGGGGPDHAMANGGGR